MSEPSKHRRKKKLLPGNVTELEDRDVAKLLFGKKAAKAIEAEVAETKSKPSKK